MRALLTTLACAFFAAGVPGVVISCVSGDESFAVDVDPGGWSTPAELRYNNSDTLTHKEIAFTFRYAADAAPREGVYFAVMTAPSGERIESALSVTIDPTSAAAGGSWRAQGNNLHEATVPLRPGDPLAEVGLLAEGILLAETGEYVFTLTPMQPTRGVWSVALSLNKLSDGRAAN